MWCEGPDQILVQASLACPISVSIALGGSSRIRSVQGFWPFTVKYENLAS